MAHLAISLLGTFRVTLDGQPVTAFQSDKGRALLAFLAVEAALPQRRERLAGLLWPECTEAQARHSLSQALFTLRRITGDETATPPFLLVTPQTVQWNAAGDSWLDVAALAELLGATSPQFLEEAIGLYHGPFLAGFSLPDSVAFEEWALLERERLHRQVLAALRQLAAQEEQAGALEQALEHTRRLLALDPLAEEAHRRAMRLLALLGRRGEALAQFESLPQPAGRGTGRRAGRRNHPLGRADQGQHREIRFLPRNRISGRAHPPQPARRDHGLRGPAGRGWQPSTAGWPIPRSACCRWWAWAASARPAWRCMPPRRRRALATPCPTASGWRR